MKLLKRFLAARSPMVASRRTKIAIVLGFLVAVCLGVFAYARAHELQSFGGRVTNVDLACGTDGPPCTLTVAGKTVITGCGLPVDATNCPRENLLNIKVGDSVWAKARKTPGGLYTVACRGCSLSPQN